MAVFSSLVAAFALFNVAVASTEFSSASTACFTTTVTASTKVTEIMTVSAPAGSSVGVPIHTSVPAPVEPTLTPSAESSVGVTIQTSVPTSIPAKPTLSQGCSEITVSANGTTMKEVKCTATPDFSVSTNPAVPTTTAITSLTPTASATSSKVVSAPRPSLNVTTVLPPILSQTLVFTSTIGKNSTTTVPTGTGGASASASYSAPPEFTDAAAGVNVGAAALVGGVIMALFA